MLINEVFFAALVFNNMRRIVTLGGGTGHFTLLSGLKHHPFKISAVVSMADDGGSTGMLRDELGVLPPGDVRQCLVALSSSSQKLRELMTYRFEDGSLKGHNFGNLFLSALEKVSGSFSKGVDEAMKILNVEGEVIPITEQAVTLQVELQNRQILLGENAINHSSLQEIGIKRIFYDEHVAAHPRVMERIQSADIIIIGPGNHYCSILPTLIIPDVSQAVRNSKAKVVYVVNLTNKCHHTEKFDVDDYVRSIESHIGKDRINCVIFNTGHPQKELLARYIEQEGENLLVKFNEGSNPNRKYKLIAKSFLGQKESVHNNADSLAKIRSFIRHDSKKLAEEISKL